MKKRLFLQIGPALAGLAVLFWAAILLGRTQAAGSLIHAHTHDATSQARVPRVLPPREPLGVPITFNKQVVRILQANCQKCHHPGDIAPFSLITYADAYEHRNQILIQTSERIMPPWHVDSSCADYLDDPTLSVEDIATLSRWVLQGAPEGSPEDLPDPLSFASTWKLGEPDQVLRMPEPMTPDFSRGDLYRCFVLPTGLTQDRYVSSVEISPGSRAMVHHVILFIDTTGAARALDDKEPGPGYTCFGSPGFNYTYMLGGWAPGNTPRPLPDGIGMPLPANSDIVMQVHYSAHSRITEPDQTIVALHFSKTPVKKRLLTVPVINTRFTIPAGNPDYEVKASISAIPFGTHVLQVMPHMHLLGHTMKVTATVPGGQKICLADVPDWSFHYQATYSFKTQIALPAGSRVDVSAHYDNSTNNPENPNDPPKNVSWGENTNDEMCIAFLGFTLDDENLTAGAVPSATSASAFSRFFEGAWRELREQYPH